MVEPTGYTALDLIGFTDKGPYDPTANYVRNDLVHVGNSTWRCKIDDTTGITPTEGANWTIFIESATSLAGMSDVTITTPTDDDGLVYNGTSQKWENVPITTKEQWKKNGAYNLCPNNATTQSLGSLVFTVNSDGTITVGSGTASAQGALTLASSIHFKTGTYKVCGTPSGGNYNIGYSFFVAKGADTVATDATNTLSLTDTFTVTSEADSYNIYVMVRNGTVIGSSITFKPLITTDMNATMADYVPYAKTNRELTDYIIKKTVTTSSISFTANTEKSGMYDLTSDIPTGYKPFGVVGYNIGGDASVRRFRVADYSGTWYLDYSVKTTTTVSYQLIVDILFVKK